MSTFRRFSKTPEAILDYKLDWSYWLSGDTIVGVTWTVPTGLTMVTSSFTTTTATVWLSGGTLDQEYEVVCDIQTAQTREESRRFLVAIEKR